MYYLLERKIPLISPEEARKWVLMVIHTNTNGQELLRPLVGIVIEQRCSEIAWYSEYETSAS